MNPHYRDWDYKGSDSVAQIATSLYRMRATPCRVSPLIFMTDPDRVSDITGSVKRLPEGATVIYRHFGKEDRLAEAKSLRAITFERAQQFLIGNDPELAITVGADGVHFKRSAQLEGPSIWRKRCPDWLITMAGVKDGTSYKGDLTALDALILSSVFTSHSPTAGEALGIAKFSQICGALPLSVFALGGINSKTAPRLVGSGAAGLAGVSGV